MNKTRNEDIDLFGLCKILWQSKRTLILFPLITGLFGCLYNIFIDTAYKSSFQYNIQIVPPFYSKEQVAENFRIKFLSEILFNEWKSKNNDSNITQEFLSLKKNVNGFELMKNNSETMVTFTVKNKNDGLYAFHVKSNNLILLNDFFQYAQFVSDILKAEYRQRCKTELKIIKRSIKDLMATNNYITNILVLDRFIELVDNGAKVINIHPSNMPKKDQAPSSLIFSLAVFLGLVISVVFILVRNAIRDYNKA